MSNAKLDAARKLLEGLVVLDPSVPMFWCALGDVRARLGEKGPASVAPDRGVAVAGRVVKGTDLLARALLMRAMFLSEQKDTPGVARDLAAIAKLPATALPATERQTFERMREVSAAHKTPAKAPAAKPPKARTRR